jgi:magnesium transporter
MTNTLYLPELREMLATSDTEELREFCQALHPARTAEFMEGLSADEAWAVLQHADPQLRSEIFGYFDRDKQLEILETTDRAQVGSLLAHLPPDDRVDMVRALSPELVEHLLPFVPVKQRRDILRLLSYPEGTAGAMMTTNFARLREGLTVREAWEQLASEAEGLETIYYIYIVDEEEHLRGAISARRLVSVIGRPLTQIDELMEHEVVSVDATDDREHVAEIVAQYDLGAIPVVDNEHHLLGIITHDDVIDIVREEAAEDVYKMGAVAPLVESENYLETSFATIWRKRTVWLSCLFVAELFTFTALSYFEAAIAKLVVLSLFVPLCISTGGNSGSQAATLITRAMAMGHVTMSDWLRVLRHELVMGLALGLTLGVIGFFRAALTPESVLNGAERWPLAMVVGQAVTVICLWGTLVGSMLPLVFRRLNVDPAYASSPFVATFVDVTGIIIFFTIAQMWM